MSFKCCIADDSSCDIWIDTSQLFTQLFVYIGFMYFLRRKTYNAFDFKQSLQPGFVAWLDDWNTNRSTISLAFQQYHIVHFDLHLINSYNHFKEMHPTTFLAKTQKDGHCLLTNCHHLDLRPGWIFTKTQKDGQMLCPYFYFFPEMWSDASP